MRTRTPQKRARARKRAPGAFCARKIFARTRGVRDFLAAALIPAAFLGMPPVERLDTGRCVETLRSPPPPKAKKATSCPRDPEPARAPLARGRVAFPEAKRAPSVAVEVARAPRETARGLMYRTALGKNDGMLFAFSGERPRDFWMKNTCIPLDMLFLAKDGSVVGVLEQVPVLNEVPRSVGCAASYVLEVNAGWSREHGVTPGMKASLQL
jgi:uncharacterized membrane protein (UPF0127 family)